MRSANFIAVASVGVAILTIGVAFAADISLHVDDNCQGPALSTTISDHDVNYPVSSVKVSSGGAWEICRDTNFGNCAAVSKTGCSNLEDIGFWGQVRSVRLSETDQKAEATVYRDVGFSGPAVYTSSAKPDTDWGNLPIRSVRVSGEWELCTKKNFKGICKRVSIDTPNLATIGIAGMVKSLRPIKGAVTPAPGGEAAFHVHRSCGGPAYATTIAVANMNYPVRSVLVRSGEWEFCTGENFGGVCKRAKEGCTNMIEAGLWGQVRSVRPIGAIPEKQPR